MSKNTITTESIFNKIEERFHKIPSLIFQDTPKSIIFFIVLNNNNEDNYEDEDNNNSKQQQLLMYVFHFNQKYQDQIMTKNSM